jgi:hypothetical protein
LECLLVFFTCALPLVVEPGALLLAFLGFAGAALAADIPDFAANSSTRVAGIAFRSRIVSYL